MKKIAILLTLAIAAIACQKEEPVIPKIEFSDPEATYTIPTEGGTATVGFSVNVNWTAAIKDAGNTTWCTISPASGNAGEAKVNILAEKNESNDNREMTLIINAGNVVKEVKVTQLQKDALLLEGEKSYEFPMEGGEISLVINHNVDYELQLPEWIVRQPEMKGMVKDDIKLKVNAQPQDGEERTGTITIKNEVKNIEISVKQAAWVPVIEIKDAVLEIPTAGGKATFNIKANIAITVTASDATWGTLSNVENAYTFEAKGVNTNFDKNVVKISLTPEAEKYAEAAKELTITQKGKANLLWSCNPVGKIEGLNAQKTVRLGKFDKYILLSDTDKIFALNQKTGAVEQTINLPEGQIAGNICTDDKGNILVATNAESGQDMNIYRVTDVQNLTLTEFIKYNTGNYYAGTTGNIRARGDIDKDAVITAVASAGAGGALLYWEVKSGAVQEWSYTKVPYTGWNAMNLCAVPGGNKLSDGMFYLGYGNSEDTAINYSLQYLAAPAKGADSWIKIQDPLSTGNENLNCLASAEFNGKKYLAYTRGAHFNYSATGLTVLDVTEPSNAKVVLNYSFDNLITRDENWANTNWTGKGAFGDVLLFADAEKMYAYFIDTNFNAFGCIEFTK